MGCPLARCAAVFALAMLVPAAWPQEAPAPATTAAAETPAPSEDPLAAAIAAVKAPAVARATDLAEARNYLVDKRQVARPLIVQLLSDDDAQVRMNAAIVLAQMAAAGDKSAATLQALETAATDTEFAVAYWGFEGLMSDGVPAADQSMVINEMMKMERPRALRLAALTTIGEKKPLAAVPIIISHLQEILTEYTAQVETVVSSSETLPTPRVGQPSYPGPAGRGPGPAGYPTYAQPPSPSGPPPPTTPSPATGGPQNAAPFNRGPGGAYRGPGREYGGAGSVRGPRGPAGAQGAGGFQNNLPGAPTPGAGLFGQPRPEAVVPLVRRADLGNMTLDKLQTLAHSVESLTIVAEVHQMGLVLEDIVSNNSPDAPPFDFKTTPPWDLDKCVAKAVIYVKSHPEYGAIPAPSAPAAPPEAPPATGPAPATTGTAPATTEATPATTAPTPATTTPAP